MSLYYCRTTSGWIYIVLALAPLAAGLWRLSTYHAWLIAPFLLILLLACTEDTESDELARRSAYEEQCMVLAETAQVYIHHFKLDGTVTYMNRYAEEITGYSRNEVIGKDFMQIFVPEWNRERVAHELQHVIEGRPAVNYEAPMLTKSGEERIMLWSGVVTKGPDGEPDGVVATGIDVTELKQAQDALQESEMLYRTLVDHGLAAVFLVQGTKFVFANKSAEQLSGYTFEEARQLNYEDLVHPDDRKFVVDRATRRLRGEPVPDRYEYRMITKSGEVRHVEIWASLVDYHGENAILANVIDVTERKRTEEERLQVERELERHKRRFYRQAISSLTRGKLEIVERDEIEVVLEDPQLAVTMTEAKDVSMARHLIESLMESKGLTDNRAAEFALAVGEAAVNAVKHTGRGTIMAGIRGERLWTAVKDDGRGMDTFILTQAVLQTGFSTKASLGLGYTFILNGSDHILLTTSPLGTTVVMEKNITPVSAPFPPDILRICDMW